MSVAPAGKEDIEAAYDQAKWAPNMHHVLARYVFLSDATRTVVGKPERVSYGTEKQESLHIYKANTRHAPIVIFVHGGGWRGGAAADFAFPAEMLLATGVHFIAVDFFTIAEAKGDLDILIDQIRRALAWIFQNSDRFGGDPSRLYIVGHSSGAHLAAMALSTCWSDYGLPSNLVKGGVLVSGIYDLGPLRHTSRISYISIDDRVERELSPLHQVSNLSAPLFIAVGTAESPEFRRQAQTYAEAGMKAGKKVQTIVGEGYNHFEILETLANPYGVLGRNLLSLLGQK
jgi:arylformamidase